MTTNTETTDNTTETTAVVEAPSVEETAAPDPLMVSLSDGQAQQPITLTTRAGGFGDEFGEVWFDAVPGPIVTWTDKAIETFVPYGAVIGASAIGVVTKDGRRYRADFTVTEGEYQKPVEP